VTLLLEYLNENFKTLKPFRVFSTTRLYNGFAVLLRSRRNGKYIALVRFDGNGRIFLKSLLRQTGPRPTWLLNGQASTDCKDVKWWNEGKVLLSGIEEENDFLEEDDE